MLTRKAVVGINRRQIYAVMPLSLRRIAGKCMIKRGENLGAQAEAIMPASPNYFK